MIPPVTLALALALARNRNSARNPPPPPFPAWGPGAGKVRASAKGNPLPDQLPRRGSALVIVLVLLSVMAALVVSNVTTLRRLKVELQLLEQKQQQSLAQRPVAQPPR